MAFLRLAKVPYLTVDLGNSTLSLTNLMYIYIAGDLAKKSKDRPLSPEDFCRDNIDGPHGRSMIANLVSPRPLKKTMPPELKSF